MKLRVQYTKVKKPRMKNMKKKDEVVLLLILTVKLLYTAVGLPGPD